ncbi:hypothetical protein J6590_030039 [Homalodisca vitripennis]|nr:hypothetical protein J6590_030039 [Homalodisca vitripennis]
MAPYQCKDETPDNHNKLSALRQIEEDVHMRSSYYLQTASHSVLPPLTAKIYDYSYLRLSLIC